MLSNVLYFATLHSKCTGTLISQKGCQARMLSNVLYIVTLHSKHTRALIFQNLCQARMLSKVLCLSIYKGTDFTTMVNILGH